MRRDDANHCYKSLFSLSDDDLNDLEDSNDNSGDWDKPEFPGMPKPAEP